MAPKKKMTFMEKLDNLEKYLKKNATLNSGTYSRHKSTERVTIFR